MSQPPPRSPRPSQAGTGTPTGVPADVERALALRDVMDHAVKVQKEITGPTRLGPSRFKLVAATLVCVPLLAFCVYSSVLRPEFIWGPSVARMPAALRDANTRFAVYLLAQRVEAHRASAGSYPSTLAALGEELEGVSYTLVSDSVFELRAAQGGKPVVFRSNENADAFLGNSPNLIQEHRR